MRIRLVVPFVLLAGSASAQDIVLPYEGFLTDANGIPISDVLDVRARIYDASTSGEILHEERFVDVLFSGGFFQIRIGSLNAIPSDLSGSTSTRTSSRAGCVSG